MIFDFRAPPHENESWDQYIVRQAKEAKEFIKISSPSKLKPRDMADTQYVVSWYGDGEFEDILKLEVAVWDPAMYKTIQHKLFLDALDYLYLCCFHKRPPKNAYGVTHVGQVISYMRGNANNGKV